jgi:hypothetical protein
MSAIVSELPLDSAMVDDDGIDWGQFISRCAPGEAPQSDVVVRGFDSRTGGPTVWRECVMKSLLGMLVLVGCGVDAEGWSEQAVRTVFTDGIPDAGAIWTQDAATGWGLLMGGVNFNVQVQGGDTFRTSYIRDNANSCYLCIDGNAVAMMYVVYRNNTFVEVLSEAVSNGDGVQRLYGIQQTRALQTGERLVVRFTTVFVQPPAQPRTSLIQPPHLVLE